MPLQLAPAEARDQGLEAALADDAAADLRLDVLLDDLVADVGEDQVPDVAPQLAALVDLDGGNAQRFLPHLARLRVVAARDRAADVGLVALARGPGHQRAAVEDRLEHRDVVVLVAAAEHVVVQDDVARVDVLAEEPHHVLAGRLERESEHRDVLGLLEHAPFRVVEAGDEIARLVEDGRARGAKQRETHLAGDRFQPALEYRQQDGIGLGLFHRRAPADRPRVITQLPSASYSTE